MKRYISLFLCLLFVLSLTACGSNEVTPDAYIGEGLLTQFSLLVKNNQRLYTDVFALSTLKADEKNAAEKGGVRWLPVIDSPYLSYSQLESTVNAVYTPECAKKILSEYDFYADIDGKLCIKSDAVKSGDSDSFTLSPQKTAKVISKSADTIKIKYEFVKDKAKKTETFVFVNTASGWRLDKFYKIG